MYLKFYGQSVITKPPTFKKSCLLSAFCFSLIKILWGSFGIAEGYRNLFPRKKNFLALVACPLQFKKLR